MKKVGGESDTAYHYGVNYKVFINEVVVNK